MADSFDGLKKYELFSIPRNWNVSPGMKQDIQLTLNEYPGTIQGVTFDRFPEKTLSFEIEGERDEFIALLVFFADCQGRLKKFWMPDLFSIFKPLEIVEDGEHRLRVEKIPGLTLHGKELLYIEMRNGDRLTREIESFSHEDDYTELILATQFEEEVLVKDMELCTLCYLGRLNQDALEITYITDSLASTKLSFIELYEEYE